MIDSAPGLTYALETAWGMQRIAEKEVPG